MKKTLLNISASAVLSATTAAFTVGAVAFTTVSCDTQKALTTKVSQLFDIKNVPAEGIDIDGVKYTKANLPTDKKILKKLYKALKALPAQEEKASE